MSTEFHLSRIKMKEGDSKNRLTLIKILDKKRRGKTLGLFRCNCIDQTEKEIIIFKVNSGDIKSCGCLVAEIARKVNAAKYDPNNKSNRIEYPVWSGMIDRCTNPNHPSYHRYGGRGISVCDRWMDPENGFENFLEDIGPRPSLKHSIDRYPDNDGNYLKCNARWATRKEQARGRSTNVNIEYNGVVKKQIEWAEHFGLEYHIVFNRIKSGWDLDKTFLTPVGKQRSFKSLELNGEVKSLIEWCSAYNMSYDLVLSRLSRSGWTLEKALTTPSRNSK